MIKTYVTTVTTEWEIRGNVTVEMINARLHLALNTIMMTRADQGQNYAFTGSKHLLEVTTEEKK